MTGFLVFLWGSREHIPDDWEKRFGWLYIIQGLLIVGFGAGATALWIPRNKQGLWRRIMFVAFGAAVTIVGIILLLTID